VPAYCDMDEPRPALVMWGRERFRKAHWVYWRLYKTRVISREYRELFHSDLRQDFGRWFRMMRALGMIRKEGDDWRVTEFGAVWMHRLQQMFSITYIDDLWDACRREAWPKEVVLA